MNCIISVVSPTAEEKLAEIHNRLSVPLFVTLHGRGTAVKSMLDLLGIESSEKRVVIAIANNDKTKNLIKAIKNELYIGVPGHGIIASVPIKSIGGGKTVSVLSEGEAPVKGKPDINNTYELIVAIANEGRTDMVMNAARLAGAAGGTVLHGKGTAEEEAMRFLNISIASEKEVILIVAKKEQKARLMQAVLEKAGPSSEAGTVLFSMPVSSIAGFNMFEE